jgi:hypothetical protein
MKSGASPLFLWVDGTIVNLALCQGVSVTEFEETETEYGGWKLCFNMLDQSIDIDHESEEAANQQLEAVYGVMQAHGYAISFPA